MAWKEDVGRLLATGTTNRPPELIIQDELHLISGALGTMVGLYETAVDAICAENGSKPKIIASTATIRRAKSQCSSLFNRDVVQFPPPGIDYDDSYFSRLKSINHEKGQFGRLYLGVMGAERNKATMEFRLLSAMLQEVKNMDLEDDVKDSFWTTTAYFNTIRELGQCSKFVLDAIPREIEVMSRRLNVSSRNIYRGCELTSRVSSNELNNILDALERGHYTSDIKYDGQRPVDIVLSSNMISVGIDVERLNLMLVAGQPKLTSEYIQATSRVGRKNPGLVVMMYDNVRNRDRSCYEQFIPFHSSFYKYVEASGVTPFAKPARERALHAVIIAMLRNFEESLAKEKDACNFNRNDFAHQIQRVKEYIVSRVKNIRDRSEAVMRDDTEDIKREIDDFLTRWEIWSDGCDKGYVYGDSMRNYRSNKNVGKLMKAYEEISDDVAIPTLSSMRSVDKMLHCSINYK